METPTSISPNSLIIAFSDLDFFRSGSTLAGSLSSLEFSTQLKSPATILIPLALPAKGEAICLKKLWQCSFGASTVYLEKLILLLQLTP